MEKSLPVNALTLVAPFANDGEFHGPSLDDFFPPAIFFEGTPFEINRIILIRFLVVAVLILLFWLGTRRMSVIPGRGQNVLEMAVGFVRDSIVFNTLGEREGRRFLPLLVPMFFFIVFMNLTSIVPFLNIAGSSVIGLPLILALTSYIAFVYAGIRKHPGAFFKNSLFPSGVPWPLYIVVTPIELISTFVLRPVTLALRLLMNMVAGHMLLVLCFSATQFFLFTAGGLFGLFSIGTFAFGFAFTLFELLVGVLQAYVFTLLTAVYINLALVDEH
ncbi:F0F1 ATP synthase subunit A [Naasia lichenicola]|uniref:ATP synthase subunit a n=1 Tax=Naasia lichenicola TaxID=2565933 RepID=A0A4S4FMT6_9MICO|nr:F0F1 ATP synthase subunit A [Naasia lichenicola]THG31494.1 F0F1 ATP synthase subunit A [Naasia lichenicola]